MIWIKPIDDKMGTAQYIPFDSVKPIAIMLILFLLACLLMKEGL